MPVQINEVIIKAVVDSQSSVLPEGSNGVEYPPGSSASEDEIMEKVLEILKEKTER